MIINLVGPPAVGKSTFASKFVLEHPEFKFCSIDAYRVEFDNEDIAWNYLFKDVVENKNVILESCGLSWRLNNIFQYHNIKKRKIITISFTGDYDEIYQRLAIRQHKRPINYNYRKSDEFAAIQYTMEEISKGKSITSIDITINTSRLSIETQYRLLCQYITQRRI